MNCLKTLKLQFQKEIMIKRSVNQEYHFSTKLAPVTELVSFRIQKQFNNNSKIIALLWINLPAVWIVCPVFHHLSIEYDGTKSEKCCRRWTNNIDRWLWRIKCKSDPGSGTGKSKWNVLSITATLSEQAVMQRPTSSEHLLLLRSVWNTNCSNADEGGSDRCWGSEANYSATRSYTLSLVQQMIYSLCFACVCVLSWNTSKY